MSHYKTKVSNRFNVPSKVITIKCKDTPKRMWLYAPKNEQLKETLPNIESNDEHQLSSPTGE